MMDRRIFLMTVAGLLAAPLAAEAQPIPKPARVALVLVINLKTASALGLTIPQALLQRADQVIE